MRFSSLFIILFFISLLVNCKVYISENPNKILKNTEKIYISVTYSNNARVNGKFIIFDLSEDIKQKIKSNDSTDDLLNSGNFLYSKEIIDRFNNYKELIENQLIKNLITNLGELNINNQIIPLTLSVPDNSVIVSIIIDGYNEGEFNLINNIPTILQVTVKITRKNSQFENIILTKKYKQKSQLETPTEPLRITKITKTLALDLTRIVNYNYLINEKLITKDNTTDKKESL